MPLKFGLLRVFVGELPLNAGTRVVSRNDIRARDASYREGLGDRMTYLPMMSDNMALCFALCGFILKGSNNGTPFVLVVKRTKQEEKIMNLLKNKPLLRNLLKQGDYLNSINGGISMTSVNTYKTNEAYVIELFTPSVSPEAFNIFLNYNQLIVYALMQGNPANEQKSMIPMFSKSFALPIEADLESIDAIQEEGKVKILVPFKSDMDQFKRKIDIKSI